MSEEDPIMRKEEIYNILSMMSEEGLEDLQLAEDAALCIREILNKIEFYKEYKRKKTATISDAISKLEDKVLFLKTVLFNTSVKHKEKTMTFPGSCRISAKNPKDKWEITDELAFIEIAKKEKEIDNIATKIEAYKIDKTKANKLFKDWQKSNKFPKGILDKDGNECVKKGSSDPSVTITFLDKDNKRDEEYEVKNDNVEEMDAL